MKPRHEQMHENRHRRHAGPFDGGKKRKPDPPEEVWPDDDTLRKVYGWKQPEDYDFEYLEEVGGPIKDNEENDENADEDAT